MENNITVEEFIKKAKYDGNGGIILTDPDNKVIAWTSEYVPGLSQWIVDAINEKISHQAKSRELVELLKEYFEFTASTCTTKEEVAKVLNIWNERGLFPMI